LCQRRTHQRHHLPNLSEMSITPPRLVCLFYGGPP
jgi:hypothetical protein